MRTLEDWVARLSNDPFTIECPHMSLCGFPDHEPPIFEGSGHIEIKRRDLIGFKMHAVPRDGTDALRKLIASLSYPYDIEAQLRLFATDYGGIEWACGWTSPQIETRSKDRWLLSGILNGLTTHLSGDRVSKISSAELVFCPSPYVPLGEPLIQTALVGSEEVSRKISGGRHKGTVLGAEIKIMKEAWTDNLWIISTTSPEFQHPYIENWLSEPLGVLCGEFVYPRLTARNFGDGSAFVQIRPSPVLPGRVPGYATQFLGQGNPTERFWVFYTRYLLYVAKWKSPDGSLGFESNKITRFYQEIMQAAQGSRWMLSLSLASAVEGIVRILADPKEMISDFPTQDVDSIGKHVEAWNGLPEIRQRVLSAVSDLYKRTISSYLDKLARQNVISGDHRQAWNHIRNQVMHGSLGEPWSSKSVDDKIEKLLELVHILTGKLVNDLSL
jgi:hypothetical protein